jgi:hypothetical protein
MLTLRKTGWMLLLAAGLFLGGWGVLSVFAGRAVAEEKEKERHPHIHAAIRELREARRDLEKADHDFGGHRVAAIKAIDHAIEQLEKALKHDKK